MQTNPLQPLVDKWYSRPRGTGPWFYAESPYGLGDYQYGEWWHEKTQGMGDLVPGNMPTRWGPLMPIPEAAELLATHGVAPAPAEYFNRSIGQETGRVYDSRPLETRPLPANLESRPDAGLPISRQSFMNPLPSVLYPRPDASTITLQGTGLACWVNDHPVIALGAAGLLYFVLRGGKKR